MATPEQRQKVTDRWMTARETAQELLKRTKPGASEEEKLKVAIGIFWCDLPSDEDPIPNVSTLKNALMVAPNGKEIECLLGLLYGSGSGSGSGSSSALGGSSEAWRQRFDDTFVDPDGRIVKYFRKMLNCRVSQFYNFRCRWYAPYVAIVQSSGWGKSRVIKQMASEGLVVFYFSLMPEDSTGYPQADQEIRRKLLSVTKVEDAYAIFCACLSWLSEQSPWPDTEVLFEKQQNLKWPTELKEKILNNKACTLAYMQNAFKVVWDNFKAQEGASILFVVDEARQLLLREKAAFTLLRRACQGFIWKADTKSGALLVAVDTLGDTLVGKVSNLAPRSRYDPSARVIDGGLELLNPISAIPTLNLLEQAKENTLEAVSEHLRLFSRGRPLWSAYLKSEAIVCADAKVQGLLTFARVKLQGGRYNPEFWLDPISSLALLGRRIGVQLCPQDRCVEELVASHMHVCLYISPSREFMLTMVPPEPVLAEAARMLVDSSMVQQLWHLNTCMLKGLVSAGERGELVGRFLLLYAMDEVLGRMRVKPVYVKDFLAKLTNNKWKGFGPGLEHLERAKVFFNAFYPYFGKKVTFKVLQQYLRNAGAIICRQGQRAYDVYIPIVLEDYDLSKVSYLAVQIKNRQTLVNSREIKQIMSNEAFRIMKSDGGLQPSFFISMQLGSNEPEPELHEIKSSHGMQGIALDGLMVINHPEDCRKPLSALLQERSDPDSIMKKYEAEEIDVTAVNDILQDLQEPQDLQRPSGKRQLEEDKEDGKKRKKEN